LDEKANEIMKELPVDYNRQDAAKKNYKVRINNNGRTVTTTLFNERDQYVSEISIRRATADDATKETEFLEEIQQYIKN
jgi:hypothetical protein